MDIFRFHNPTSPTKLEQGEIINGAKSKMWVERYREAGEFQIIANTDTGIKDKLPIGALVSHIDTTEIMIVENHEIREKRGNEPEIVISGRGFETFLENRIVGTEVSALPSNVAGAVVYTIPSNSTWNQAITMIDDHLLSTEVLEADNAVQYYTAMTDISDTFIGTDRPFKRGTLYKGLLDLLAVDNLGIKLIRPGPWSPLGGASPNFVFFIHKGVDRTSQVILSYDTGEIESADYLWSNKKLKNAALVSGKWVQVFVDDSNPANVGYKRRVMYIDGSDFDGDLLEPPVDPVYSTVVANMETLARDMLAAQVDVSLTKPEVSKDIHDMAYRINFDVGDIITVNGNYDTTTTMRISEYVEIEDENGQSGYPTLTTV